MAKDPAFLFYSADFYMGTIGMTDAQVGQYIRLMCLQHQQGRLTDAHIKSVMGNKRDPVVMSKFVQDENGLYNERLESETEKRNEYVSSRRRNARSRTSSVSSSNEETQKHMDEHMPEHMDEHMGAQATKHMPEHMENENENENEDINTKKPKKGVTGGRFTQPTLEARFDAIWMLYPKKQGKAVAFNAYKRAIKSGVTDEEITKGVQAYIAYIQRRGIDEQYIKQGGTYFNQQAWNDKYGSAAPAEKVYEDTNGRWD